MKEGSEEDPRSRRAVVRAFADEKSAGVVDAKPIWSGVALRRPGKDRPFCTGLGSGLLQHGIGRRCLLWSAAFCTGLSAMSTSFPCFPRHIPA